MKGKKKTVCCVLLVTVFLFLRALQVSHVRKKFKFSSTTISCHYVNEGNSLPDAEGVKPRPDSIFFLETSCEGGLNSRQACSVESAARLHPKRDIHVYFNSPVSDNMLKNSCLSELVQLKNVKLARLHSVAYASGTPLANLIANRENAWSDYPIQHTADLLRFVTLYKYGGQYLDLDMLVVKPLDALGKNWSARESEDIIAIGAIALDRNGIGRTLVSKVLYAIKEDFRPDEYIYNGAGALMRALMELCNTTEVLRMSAGNCRGVQIYEPDVMYPIYFDEYDVYFKANGNVPANTETYAHHLWNYHTKNMPVPVGSPYEKLATIYCPTIRQWFGSKFGS